MLLRTLWTLLAVAVGSGAVFPSPAAAQAPPPGAVVEPVTAAQAGCTGGMTVVGFDHGPDGRPVVAWQESCPAALRVFWARADAGAWTPHEFNSDRRYQGGGDADIAHRLQVLPGSGVPMLLYAAPGLYNEFNTYRVNLDDTLGGSFSSTYIENLAMPQGCVYPNLSPGASPTATAANQVQWASALPSCNSVGPVRINGAAITATPMATPRLAFAVAPDGGRHLLWSSDTSLFYTQLPAGTTAPTTVTLSTTLARLGGEVALVADAAGVLHALVRGYSPDSTFDGGTLVYFQSADGGATWTAPEFVDPYDAVPANPGIHTDIALAVDADGVPAVAYWKSRQQLWYAKRDGVGPSWNRAQVASRPNIDVSRAVALDFDARNQPVLVYFDQPNNRLVAARTLPPAPAATITTMHASTLVARPGQTVFFEATVRTVDETGATPSGPFTFINVTGGDEYRTTLDANGGAFSTGVGFPEGTHVVRGRYEGTEHFAPSEASLTITVRTDTLPEIRPIPDRLDLVGTTSVFIPIEASAGSIEVSGLPDGATYSDAEGPSIVVPFVRSTMIGAWRVTVSVSNASGSATTSFLWRIRDNTAPFIYDPGPQRSLAGRQVEVRLRTLDPDNDPLLITHVALPPGLTIVVLDPATLLVSGTVGQAGSFNVSVRVFDGFASFERHFTWTIAAWSDLRVTTGLTMDPAYAGDRQTRGLLSVRALEIGGSALDFDRPEVVGYDIDLPAGAVFAGVEGSRTPDGSSALGGCAGSTGRIRCWQPINGVGDLIALDLWMHIHLIMPVRTTPMTARVRARLPYDLDPDLTNNDIEATVVPTVRPATGRRAIVIVMENNEEQQNSTTYGGLATAARGARIDLVDLGVPPDVATLVQTVAGELYQRTVDGLGNAMATLNRGITDRLIANRGNSGGCYTDLLTSLRDDPSRSREHPYLGLIDQYLEVWIAECLREMATPYYDRVEVLTDSAATFASFKATVEQLHAEGYTMDLLLDIHGCGLPQTLNNVHCGEDPSLRFADGNAFRDGRLANGDRPGHTLQSINSFFNGTSGYIDADSRFIEKAEPGFIRLNDVYMVSCWGSNFNQMWIDMGARASNGAEELNYMVLSSPLTFLDQFTRNAVSLDEAARRAYEEERLLFEGLPFSFTVDFTAVPGCSNCRFTADLGAVYAQRLARELGELYGEDKSQAVDPVPSSRRVGLLAAPIAAGQSEIVLIDSGTGTPLVVVTPTSVEQPGMITLTTMTEGPALDAHRGLGTPAVHYDLAVSAVLSGATGVCFTYEEGRFTDESTVQLLHYEDGAWVNRTTSMDTTQNVVCGTVTSFSPFAVTEFVNRVPTADAGADVTVQATSVRGATLALDGSASADPEDDALAFTWSWAGGRAEGAITTVTLPEGTHLVTLTVSDTFGAVAIDSLTVTIVAPPLTGRMRGHGHVDTSGTRSYFGFDVGRSSDGQLAGGLELKVRRPCTAGGSKHGGTGRMPPCADTYDRFGADGLTFVAFTNGRADATGPRRDESPDAVTFAGVGFWNDEPGYRFEARAISRTSPGRPHGWFEVTITAPDGHVVARVAGEVDGGRIISRAEPASHRYGAVSRQRPGGLFDAVGASTRVE